MDYEVRYQEGFVLQTPKYKLSPKYKFKVFVIETATYPTSVNYTAMKKEATDRNVPVEEVINEHYDRVIHLTTAASDLIHHIKELLEEE